MTQPKFKTYTRQQLQLIPARWDEKIPEAHPVRIVDSVVDKLDLSSLYSSYKGGGTTSHNPKMLLKATETSICKKEFADKLDECQG
jgi:transposase